MFFKIQYLFLLSIALTVVYAKVTFKVIAVDGTPYVIINKTKYSMKLLEYPIYQATVDVSTPVKYHYSLTINGKTEEESFTREATSSTTLNEFFNRSITVKKHPLLPLVYKTPSTVKLSKLYDDTHVSTILINIDEKSINALHSNPLKNLSKYKCEVIYVNPYKIKKFTKAYIALSGQSSLEAKKLSYRISGLQGNDGKELYSRKSIRLRAEHLDPSFIRDKLYSDILNSLGVPTIQNKLTRLYINKQPIGLFDLTDDINSTHFLKNTFNGGEKFTEENALFKADYYPGGNAWGDLGYHGDSSSMYDIYYYRIDKEDKKNYSNKEKFRTYLLPFLKEVNNYPTTKSLNFDIKSFLKQMVVEYAAGGVDNFWIRPGNYFIFKDVKKNKWNFIDCDFHYTLGLSKKSEKLMNYSINDYTKFNDEINTTSRPILDKIRKVSDDESFFMDAFKKLIQYVFNINALGPRIDSLADMIREDAYWDLKLTRMSKLSDANDFKFTSKDFESHVKDTSVSSSNQSLPLKYWIIKRSKNIADQLNISVPTSLMKSSLGNFECSYDSIKVSTTTTKKTTTTTTTKKTTTTTTKKNTSTNTSGRCGASYGSCANSKCCSKYGYCGTTDEYCGSGCQSEYGKCNSSNRTTKKTTTTTKKTTTTTKKTTTTTKKNTSTNTSGRCGASYGSCANSKCCSKYGYCGTTDEYCGSGCQSEFGKCNTNNTTTRKTTTTTKKTTTTTKKTTTTTKKSTSTNTSGRCGATYGSCASGKCCSKYGYCGTTDEHCGSGCQSSYGKCNSNTIAVSTESGRCGANYGKCAGKSECCSKYGYCGVSSDHCGSGCQSAYGICS